MKVMRQHAIVGMVRGMMQALVIGIVDKALRRTLRRHPFPW